jgi:hypothetical protein
LSDSKLLEGFEHQRIDADDQSGVELVAVVAHKGYLYAQVWHTRGIVCVFVRISAEKSEGQARTGGRRDGLESAEQGALSGGVAEKEKGPESALLGAKRRRKSRRK